MDYHYTTVPCDKLLITKKKKQKDIIYDCYNYYDKSAISVTDWSYML